MTISCARAHKIVSNASCTTNCLAPVAAVLRPGHRHPAGLYDDHPCLYRRPASCRTRCTPIRAGRGRPAYSMIPTSTGAAKAVGLVLPEAQWQARWDVHPGADGECFHRSTLKFIPPSARPPPDEINKAIDQGGQGSSRLKGYPDHQRRAAGLFRLQPQSGISSIFDLTQTQVVDGKLVPCRQLGTTTNGAFPTACSDTAVMMGKLG